MDAYMSVLASTPLHPTSAKVPDGLRYHVIDIYVDELDEADASRDGKLPLEEVLQPLRRLGRETKNKKVRERVNEALADERLVDWSKRPQDDVGDFEHADEQGNGHQGDRGGEARQSEHAVEYDEEEEWGGISD